MVISWGATENSRNLEILQEESVPLFNQTECQNKFSQVTLIDEQFCAGGRALVCFFKVFSYFLQMELIHVKVV